MDVIIKYYNENPALLTYTLVILGVCIVLGIATVFAYKSIRRRRNDRMAQKQAFDAFHTVPEEEEEKTRNALQEQQAEEETTENAASTEEKPERQPQAQEKENKPARDELKSEAAIEKAPAKDKSEPEEKEAPPAREELKSEAAPEEEDKPKNTRYNGKWIIENEDGKFYAVLVASNGEVLLKTETYSALSGIKSGIETINKNIAKNNFALSTDKNGKYFFKLYSSSTRLLCISSVYGNRSMCERAVESVKRFSKTATIVKRSEIEKK